MWLVWVPRVLSVVEVVNAYPVLHVSCRDGCIVTEDGWAECGERACPECGGPAVQVTVSAQGLEWGRCECGEEWRA